MSNRRAGFTLIELTVSMGIMALISTVIFFNFPRFNQQTALSRAAREFVSALRDAQARAVAVTKLPDAGPDQFPSNYGIHLQAGDTYELFSDSGEYRTVPVKYDSSGGCDGECIRQFKFTHGIRITNITAPNGNSYADGFHVLYYRPDPSVKMTDKDGKGPSGIDCIFGCPGVLGEYGPYVIRLETADGAISKSIQIWGTGQISIQP